jgi:hypothetical protein
MVFNMIRVSNSTTVALRDVAFETYPLTMRRFAFLKRDASTGYSLPVEMS